MRLLDNAQASIPSPLNSITLLWCLYTVYDRLLLAAWTLIELCSLVGENYGQPNHRLPQAIHIEPIWIAMGISEISMG